MELALGASCSVCLSTRTSSFRYAEDRDSRKPELLRPGKGGGAPLFLDVKPCHQAGPRDPRRWRLRNGCAIVNLLRRQPQGSLRRAEAGRQARRREGLAGVVAGPQATPACPPRCSPAPAAARWGWRHLSKPAPARGHSAALPDSQPCDSTLPRGRRGEVGGTGAPSPAGLPRGPTLFFPSTGKEVHEGSGQRSQRGAAAQGGTV